MEQWREDARSEAIIVELEALAPEDHLLRKIGKVRDCRCSLDTNLVLYGHNMKNGTMFAALKNISTKTTERSTLS